MHPRGVHELRDLGKDEKRSADGDDLTIVMHELHEQVKQKLQDSSIKYKGRVDLKRREAKFEVGYLVLDHIKKERFLKGEYSKLTLKKIGPCRILRKFLANAYEIEFPIDVAIYSIFNVVDLNHYNAGESSQTTEDTKSILALWPNNNYSSSILSEIL